MPRRDADTRRTDVVAASGSRAVLLFWCVAWTLFAVVLMCVSHNLGRLPLLADNQHYFYISERAASGIAPHVSQFDPKHALGSLLPAAAMRAGRALAVSDLAALRAASISATAGCVGLVWLLAWRLTGGLWTAHLAALAMATFDDFTLMGVMGGQPKNFLAFFVVLFLLAGFRRRPFVSGATAALAFLCWQPAIVLLVAAVVPLFTERGRTMGVLALLAGFVSVNLAYESYFWLHDAVAVQLVQAYEFPARFMGGTWPPPLKGLLLHATWILRLKHGVVTSGTFVPASFFLALVLGWLLVLARGAGFARRIVASNADLFSRAMRRRGLLTFVAALHVVLPFVLWNYQGFPDRFMLLPFVAVSAAALWTKGLDSTRVFVRRIGVASAAIATLVLVFMTVGQLPRRESSLNLPLQRELARRVGEELDAGQSVWAVGCTHLLAFNHANNFVRYGLFFRGMDAYLRRTFGGSAFRPRRDGELPDVVLLSRRSPDRLTRWLDRHYVAEANAEFQRQYIRVFRLAP